MVRGLAVLGGRRTGSTTRTSASVAGGAAHGPAALGELLAQPRRELVLDPSAWLGFGLGLG